MHYIIMDLEWNNTYAKRKKGFINEIIEIGAVKLDEQLNEIDRFSSFINVQIGKKLRGSVKKLTNISNDDINDGPVFTRVMCEFRNWIGNSDNIILTWGDGDIRVLIDNYRYLNGIERVPFLSNYVDVQKYVQSFLRLPMAKQIGLSAAAELLKIDEEQFNHHRATDDSLITAECFRRTFNKEKLGKFIKPCKKEFYDWLAFKPYTIGNINSPLVDKSLLSFKCSSCGNSGALIKDWKYTNHSFVGLYNCPNCDVKYKVSVRFKQYYDRLETKKTISVLENKEKQEVAGTE